MHYGQRNLEWTWIKNTPTGLLLRTLPAHLAYSLAGVAHYLGRGRGAAALRGKVAALVGLPRLMRKRRDVQRTRRVDVVSLRGAAGTQVDLPQAFRDRPRHAC